MKSLWKRFFSRLSVREKMWLLIFSWVFLAVWGWGLTRRYTQFFQEWKVTKTQIEGYRYWIKNEGRIQDSLVTVLKWIDPEKTLTGTQFAGKVEELVRKTNLTYSMTSPKTREGDIFDAHTLQMHCENSRLEDLISFEQQVHQIKPYIGLEKVKIRANTYNPPWVEADFDLIALQLKKLASQK
jgi:hypothetical protein